MEGSESEAVFDSLNLNPQLFLNEVLNTVDDLLLQTFDFFYQEASTKINSQKSQDLRQAVDSTRHKVQSVLDQKLAVWEKYCLRHCFTLPQGFHMPNKNTEESSGKDIDPGAAFDPDIDVQLDSLRKKLAKVGQESEMLNREVQALERQSTLDARCIDEAVQLYDQNSSYHELFQEIMTTASELRMKMGKLNPDMIEETEQMKAKRIYSAEMDLSAINPAKGLSNVQLEDLQEFVTHMKTAEHKCLKRGVKEVVKSIRRGHKGLCVIAGNISPIDVITHVPILCEESDIPYVYVTSKEDLATAGATKRPTCCVLVMTKPAKGEIEQGEQEKLKSDYDQVVSDVTELTSTLF